MVSRCLVECVLDTGQRIQSVDLDRGDAAATARDMRSRMRVVTVTIIDLATGEARTRASRNVMASAPEFARDDDGAAMRHAFGA